MKDETTPQLLQEHLLNLLDSAPEAIIISQDGDSILFVNKSAEKLFGYQKKELLGQAVEILLPKWLKKKHIELKKIHHKTPTSTMLSSRERLFARKKDGSEFPARIMLGVLPVGKGVLIISLVQDITPQREAEKSSQLFRTLLNQSTDAIEILDPSTGLYLEGNETAWRALGYSREEFLSLKVFDIDPKIDKAIFTKRIKKLQKLKTVTLKTMHQRKDGSTFPVEVSLQYVTLEKDYLVAVVRDITDLCKAQETIHYQLTHDALTDLPNMITLQKVIEQKISDASQKKSSFALLTFSINNLNDIVSTIGYEHGDSLLQQFGPRIKNILNEQATIFRTGTREFATLLDLTKHNSVTQMVERLLQALEAPFFIGKIPINLEVSAGIVKFPSHGRTKKTLLRRANIALNASRKNGTYIFYHAKYDSYNPANLVLMGELRKAITQNELELYFQPKVSIKTRTILSVEALIRWNNPKRGFILPEEFVRLAEHTALIHPLSLWTFNAALSQCQLWHKQKINIPISINISARNFLSKKFCEQLFTLLQKKLTKNIELEIEITETAIMADPQHAAHIIQRMRTLGVKFAIDDFGTGYSSLSYLKQLPIDALKIDKSFVLAMLRSYSDAVIVKSIIELAHNLDLVAVAEGVENKQILERLALINCDIAQGFYTGKPMPAKAITRLLGSFGNSFDD